MRAFFAGLLSLILVGVAVSGVLLLEYQRFLQTPIELVAEPAPDSEPDVELTQRPDQRIVEIPPGTRLRDLAARLADDG
ncbi:MAG: hypothetical protein K9L32_14600, partial [Chromatiaceae bacterium]|nr:hypothetical protein [Chromatiaceae bacterium]